MLVDSVEALESEASNEPSARTSIELDDYALSQDSKEERERESAQQRSTEAAHS